MLKVTKLYNLIVFMAYRPLRKELEQLYHQIGQQALVWYAWRSALRINAPSQISYGDNSINAQTNHQLHTEITADQRQQVAAIVSELLKDAANLPTKQLMAVTETKKALEAPVEDQKSPKLLGTVWHGINEAADFTKNKAIPITDFAIKNKESIGASLTVAAAAFGVQTP